MDDGWVMCDVDGNGMLDMQEFTECYRLYRHGRQMHMYWVQFAIDQEAGLTMDEFHAGYKMAEPDAPEDEIHMNFMNSDRDGNGRLSWEEYEGMYWDNVM